MPCEAAVGAAPLMLLVEFFEEGAVGQGLVNGIFYTCEGVLGIDVRGGLVMLSSAREW